MIITCEKLVGLRDDTDIEKIEGSAHGNSLMLSCIVTSLNDITRKLDDIEARLEVFQNAKKTTE